METTVETASDTTSGGVATTTPGVSGEIQSPPLPVTTIPISALNTVVTVPTPHIATGAGDSFLHVVSPTTPMGGPAVEQSPTVTSPCPICGDRISGRSKNSFI